MCCSIYDFDVINPVSVNLRVQVNLISAYVKLKIKILMNSFNTNQFHFILNNILPTNFNLELLNMLIDQENTQFCFSCYNAGVDL